MSIYLYEHTYPSIGVYVFLLLFVGARGVMVIVAGYGHGDTSLNPGPD